MKKKLTREQRMAELVRRLRMTVDELEGLATPDADEFEKDLQNMAVRDRGDDRSVTWITAGLDVSAVHLESALYELREIRKEVEQLGEKIRDEQPEQTAN